MEWKGSNKDILIMPKSKYKKKKPMKKKPNRRRY